MIGTVFDCDGTLVIPWGARHEVARTLASEAGIAADRGRRRLSFHSCRCLRPAPIYMSNVVSASNEAVLEMIFDCMRASTPTRWRRPVPLEFVRLHERGVPMAVASSTPGRHAGHVRNAVGSPPT